MSYISKCFTHFCTITLVSLMVIGGLTIDLSPRVLAAVLTELAAVAAPTTPSHLNFQGVARDAEGKRLTGAYDITFAIYDSPVAATEKWQETQTGVTVRDGNFSVLLGTVETLPPGLFNSPDRFVGITVAGFAELQPRQRFASVPYALHAADGVPVGAVIDWWRADASVSVPDGYLICNGQTVNDGQSPLNGKVLPDLTDKFVRGVTDPTYVGFGSVGGSEYHNHDISYDHPAVTANTTDNGAHNHKWGIFDATNYFTFANNGALIQATNYGDGMDNSGAGTYPLTLSEMIYATGSPWAYTEISGNHHHSVTVDLPPLDTRSGPNSSLPPYVGLLKLCRVR